MGDLLQLNCKPIRNLYLVDNYHIVLACSIDQSLEYVQQVNDENDQSESFLIDDDKVLHVIKSGKVSFINWDREPTSLEMQRLDFKITVREFINRDLKRFATPSGIDIIDENAVKPKR